MLVVDSKQRLLWWAIKRRGQPPVQPTGHLNVVLVLKAVTPLPPVDQLGPRQPGLTQQPVVEEAILRVLDHLYDVVNGVPKDNLRLGAGRGEDDVLELAVNAAYGCSSLLILKLLEL
jgi:hypothetical protein